MKEGEEVGKEAVKSTLERALSFYTAVQTSDGNWASDLGGPMFLLPGLVGATCPCLATYINFELFGN